MFDFCKEYLSSVNHVDIEQVLKALANEQRLRDEQETRERANRALAHDMHVARRQRSAAFEEMDARVSAGLSPTVHVNPSERW